MEQNNLEHIKEILETLEVQSLDDSLIQDNKLYFLYNEKKYFVKMPSQKELTDAHSSKDKYKMAKITTEKVYTKQQIKKILKETQNIDIDELENKRLEYQKQLREVYIDLALVNPINEQEILQQKLKIKDIENKHLDIFTEITEHLAPALENQLERVYVEYLTATCTYIQSEDKIFNKVWDKLSDFEQENSGLNKEAIKYMTFLLIKTNR